MNRKYDMRICKCGRIHMVPNEKIEKHWKIIKIFFLSVPDADPLR